VTHERQIIGKPTKALCAGCSAVIEGHDIVRWDATAWACWCWPCFKRQYLPNLARLQELDQ